ncbi:MAG TPA: hypothetical protein ENJ56_06265 [Anaerolineae bacterium]|nr:hypothetical protein [Anaerolineae bacterium]
MDKKIGFGGSIGGLLLLLAFILLTICILAALGIGFGWILTQILPFTLFEASVYGLLCLVLGAKIFSTMLESFLNFGLLFDDEDE